MIESMQLFIVKEILGLRTQKNSGMMEDIVNAGMRVLLKPTVPHWTVQECSLVYGGMSYITVVAKETQSALLGK